MSILVLTGLSLMALVAASMLALAAWVLLTTRQFRRRAGIAPLRRRLLARAQMRLRRPVLAERDPLAGDALSAFTDVMRSYRHCHAGPEALEAEQRAIEAAKARGERR